MTKQRRSFFVNDILHMVMPNANKNDDLKRKRSISSDDRKTNDEEISTKKFRVQDLRKHDHHDDDESNCSRVVDIEGDNESCISDNSNNVNNQSGKFGYTHRLHSDRLPEEKKRRRKFRLNENLDLNR